MVKIIVCLIIAIVFGFFGWLGAMHNSETPTMGDILVTLKSSGLIWVMGVLMVIALAI